MATTKPKTAKKLRASFPLFIAIENGVEVFRSPSLNTCIRFASKNPAVALYGRLYDPALSTTKKAKPSRQRKGAKATA